MAISYTQLTTSEGEMQHCSHLAELGGWILTVSIYPCCRKDNGMRKGKTRWFGLYREAALVMRGCAIAGCINETLPSALPTCLVA